MRRLALLVLIAAAALLSMAARANAADPVIAAAGDIACAPSFQYFNGGAGSSTYCHQRYTSDLLVNQGLAAVLPVGDVQYECAGAPEFAQSYDPSWGRLRSITHPAAGNHEYKTSSGTGCDTTGRALGYFQYFGAAAGDPAKGYYSYDVGTWHLISLNTNLNCATPTCGAGSAQEQWLKADLAAHPNSCTLAYFHYPVFSSKTPLTYGNAFWQALYDAGADVVIGGHVHSYERFAPQTPAAVADPAFGIREFVVGTGGRSLEGFATTIAANSEVRSRSFGVLKLTLHPNGYDWQFVPDGRNGNTFSDTGTGTCHAAPGAQDTTPPSVSLTAPADGATVAGTVTLTANASDAGGVNRVEFLVDGTVVGTDTSSPYSASWDTTAATGGSHQVAARAFDSTGNQATSPAATVTVDNSDATPPSVSLTAPANGATLSGTASLTANASDAGGVNRVEFLVDGSVVGTDTTAPYSGSWDTTGAANGSSHQIAARAFDNSNNQATSAAATVTVDNSPPQDTTPPSVSLTAPANGATLSGTASLTANASDAGGVNRVEFLVDGSVVGTDTTAPYSGSWDTTGAANGSSHQIAARAFDNSNNQATSTAATVTVDNSPPPAGIARRAQGTSSGTSNGATVTIPAQAVAGDVAVAIVTTSSSSATFPSNPAGWTRIANSKAVDFYSAAWYHVVQAGEPGTPVSFTSSAATDYWTAGIVVYSGVSASAPVDVFATSAPTTVVQSVVPGPITPSRSGEMILSFAAADVSTVRTWTEDAGTELFDVRPTNLTLVANEQLQSAAAAVSRTLTISGATQELAGYIIGLRPA